MIEICLMPSKIEGNRDCVLRLKDKGMDASHRSVILYYVYFYFGFIYQKHLQDLVLEKVFSVMSKGYTNQSTKGNISNKMPYNIFIK